MTWGEIITALAQVRHDRGLSLRALARQVGCAGSTLWAWERGDRQPGLAVLIAWACALGYSVRIEPIADPAIGILDEVSAVDLDAAGDEKERHD